MLCNESDRVVLGVPTAYDGTIEIGEAQNVRAPLGTGLVGGRFLRYPGCQQLTIRLPHPARSGYTKLQIHKMGGELIESCGVLQRLYGDVDLILDTLGWPPGKYKVEVNHINGWHHELTIDKGDSEFPVTYARLSCRTAAPIARPAGEFMDEPSASDQAYTQCLKSPRHQHSRFVTYDSTVPDGTIEYIEGDLCIRLEYRETGSGYGLVIDLPNSRQWEGQTGTPLSRRNDIVEFIAESVRREQVAPKCYILTEDALSYR